MKGFVVLGLIVDYNIHSGLGGPGGNFNIIIRELQKK
jgi:hypothetical protein